MFPYDPKDYSHFLAVDQKFYLFFKSTNLEQNLTSRLVNNLIRFLVSTSHKPRE